MRGPLLLDLSHTSHTRARTGVQRVARGLCSTLAEDSLSITFDPYLRGWRPLEAWEKTNLQLTTPGGKRGAQWPLSAKIRGRLARLLRGGNTVATSLIAAADAGGTILPEIFSPQVAANLALLPRPRVAVFHDAIPLKLPEFTPRKTVARFPVYLRELLSMDGIAAVSDDSRDALAEYWQWLGVKDTPPIRTIGLGIDAAADVSASRPEQPPEPPAATPMIVLCVGSIEGRKNHLALFAACEQLWAAGLAFELHVVGMARAETAAAALTRLRELQTKGRPLRHDDAADDAALERAYRACSFTVYPSLMEGFGLPVLESLARAKPCICSQRGALGEATRGGGCFALERVDAAALAGAIQRLITDQGEVARLADEARNRTFRTWRDYAADLAGWVHTLSHGSA